MYVKGSSKPKLAMTARAVPELRCSWKIDKFKAALAADGAYLLRSNQGGWSAQEFWETYIQLTVAKRAGLQTLIRKGDSEQGDVGP